MMTEIDLDGPAVATTATSAGTIPTPSKSGQAYYADEIDLSETFNDEEEEDNIIYDEEEGDGILKVTKKRRLSSSGRSDDDGHSVRAKAVCWTLGAMVMSIIVIGAIVGVSALLSSFSSSSNAAASKNPHSNNRVSNEQAERDAELPSWYGNTTTSVSSDASPGTAGTPATTTNTDNIVMMPSDKDENELLPISLGCLTDRFDNEHNPVNNRLYPGQFICSKDEQRRYRFGLTLTADIVMEDLQVQSFNVIYENTHHPGKKNSNYNKNTMNATMTMTPAEMAASYHKDNFHFYVTLHTDGSMIMNQVHLITEDDGSKKKKTKALWTATPQQGVGEYLEGATIGLLEQCLPYHDCPHLHLHQGGTMVLNWVDDSRSDSWQSKNAMHVYGF